MKKMSPINIIEIELIINKTSKLRYTFDEQLTKKIENLNEK